MSGSNFVCPIPLVSVDMNLTLPGITIPVVPGENCVVPCPTIIYNSDEWGRFKEVLFVGSLISLVSSSIVLLSHTAQWKKYYIRMQFVAGFFVNSFVLLVFCVLNKDDDLICSGNTHYLERSPFCVFQGAALVFVFTWIEWWSVILALDSYMMVKRRATSLLVFSNTSSRNDSKYQQRMYLFGGIVLCTVVTVTPLIANNYGFDPRQNVPMCLFLFSDNPYYFWFSYFTPFVILVISCLVFSILGICQIQQIFVTSKRYFANDNNGDSIMDPAALADGDKSTRGSSFSQSHYSDNTGYGQHLSQSLSSVSNSSYSDNSNNRSLLAKKLIDTRDSLHDLYDLDMSDNEDEMADSFSREHKELHNHTSGKNRPQLRGVEGSSNNLREPLLTEESKMVDAPSHQGSQPTRESMSNTTSMSMSSLYRSVAEFWRKPSNRRGLGAGNSLHNNAPGSSHADLSRIRTGSATSNVSSTYSNETVSLGSHGTHGSHDTRYDNERAGDVKKRKLDTKKARQSILSRFFNEEAVKETWKYNGRTIVFVSFFCFSTLYIVPVLFDLQYIHYGQNQQSATNFIECLVAASVSSQASGITQTVAAVSVFAQGKCGSFPSDRPNMDLVFSALLWCSAYGIIPSIIFGSYAFNFYQCRYLTKSDGDMPDNATEGDEISRQNSIMDVTLTGEDADPTIP